MSYNSLRTTYRRLIGLLVVLAIPAVSLAVVACGGGAAVPTSVPTAAAKLATQPIATTGAAAVATGAAAVPTVAAAATAAAPTVAAGATALAPTVSAAVTAVGPTVAAVVTYPPAVTPPAATISAAQTSVVGAASTVSSTTVGQLATSGQTVYTSHCAACHGAQGQGGIGPPVIGPNEKLAKYGTALGLLTKISTTMPRTAPASLPPDQYLQVTAYLLVQNNYVQPSTTLSSIQFGTVQLKK